MALALTEDKVDCFVVTLVSISALVLIHLYVCVCLNFARNKCGDTCSESAIFGIHLYLTRNTRNTGKLVSMLTHHKMLQLNGSSGFVVATAAAAAAAYTDDDDDASSVTVFAVVVIVI